MDDRIETVQELKTEIQTLQKRSSGSAACLPLKNFVPPGFRTKTPWKMLIAVNMYFLIFSVCLSMEVEGATVFHLWLERITALSVMLSVVFCCFNYCNIRRFIPLCTDRRRLIRYSGVLILNLAVVFPLLFAMLLLESIF